MAVAVVLAGMAVALAAFWLYFSWHFDYWSRRGVPSFNPLCLYGERGISLLGNKTLSEQLPAVYARYKPLRFVGTFMARQPALIVLDLELVKAVLTKDFASFHGRGQPCDEQGDPLSANLFNLEGPRWKNLRVKLSPAFTSGKLKAMFPLMVDIGEQLDEHLKEKASRGEEVEFRELLVQYATDVIGSVAFGINCNSIGGQAESEFSTMAKEAFARNFRFLLRYFLVTLHPVFLKLLPFKRVFRRTTDFFLGLMRETVEFRERHAVERHDFVSLMLEARRADRADGVVRDRSQHIELGPEVMAAQAFFFFVAGLDNVANSIGFALHELAVDPELQARAAREVREAVAKHGALTYDAIREDMKLVERIVQETLRKWGPAGALTRKPNGVYKIPGTDVTIDSSVSVMIPTSLIHRDPEFFPDPERFDPERFTEEAKARRHPYAYLPFGEGPRFCVAERFALLEMKLCLAALLAKYQVAVGDRTDLALTQDPKVFMPCPKNGFWLRVQTRT